MAAGRYDADVVVIGGGPAGSAAAITCAKRGLSVIVLERDRVFGERPGETMHPGVRPILEQLGLGSRIDALATGLHSGIWIEWGGPARFQAFGSDESGPWQGFHLWRPDFDGAMLSVASEAGADVRMGITVSGIGEEQGTVRQIETDHGPVIARMVIDATGRARHVARQLEISFEARSPRLIARYGYVTGSCPARDDAPKISGDMSGWTWTARIRDSLYQWTRVDFNDVAKDDWLPEEFRGLRPHSRTRGADVTWRIAERPAGPNWFMAGDAAATLDPTSSRGVLKSILTGIMAGHLADAAIGGKLTPQQAASSYHQWLLDWFNKDVTQMEQFYRLLGQSALA
jgi:flavin-dependent dehydrogenase